MHARSFILAIALAAAMGTAVHSTQRARATSPTQTPARAGAGAPLTGAGAAIPAVVDAPAGGWRAAPLLPPAIEPEEVLASMTRDELASEVAQMEGVLERRDAIRRLNDGKVGSEERDELGAILHRLALMKHQLAVLKLQELERAVAEYGEGHAARVAKYVHTPK